MNPAPGGPLPATDLHVGDDAAALSASARDAVWLQRMRGDDHDAFQALFREYHAPLCTFALHCIGAPDVAEDLVQEVMIDLWDRRHTLELRSSLRGYLMTAVRHAAHSFSRHERVVDRHEAQVLPLFSRPVATPENALDGNEALKALRAAIAKLPERCRLVFSLQREQGMTYAEVADALGISPKTVDVQMGRALKFLRARLGPDWP